MKMRNVLASLLACVAILAHSTAFAGIITQWNFNSVPPDASTGTGTIIPSIGAGTASLIGGTTSTFASGTSNGGSSDLAGDNSGWNTTTYPATTSGNKTAGTQYLTSTAGFTGITVSYDLRHSNTSSRFETLQYTIDGTNYIDAATFTGAAGDTWFNGRSVDLSTIPGVNNNPLFGIRVVSSFDPAGSSYVASNSGSNYATTGTWRFDMVTVSGTAVPEPNTVILASMAGVALLAARRVRR